MAERGAVLAVDDASIRAAVRAALEVEGYRVVRGEDAAAGLAALAEVAPSVVSLDARMPNADGWEFSRGYRAAAHTAPVVAMTAAWPPTAGRFAGA